MERKEFAMRSLALVLAASAVLFAVPVGFAADAKPRQVELDGNLKVMFSSEKVLKVMNQMAVRFHGLLSKVEITQSRSGGSTYRFHYDRAEPSPLRHGVGYFDVQVSFGVAMKAHVGTVGEPVLMR